MNKITKVWLIIGASLVLIGSIVFTGVMVVNKWDFSKLQTVTFETNEYDINEEFLNIRILTDTADIQIVPSDTDTGKVVCFEKKNLTHSVSVKDDTLLIEVTDSGKWYENIGIVGYTPEIIVFLPADEYGALWVKAGTGDINVDEKLKFENVDIAVSTGDITYSGFVTGTMDMSATTGDITLKNVSSGNIKLAVSTGKITADSVEAKGDIETKVSTGDIKFADVSCVNFVSAGTTGDVHFKNVIASGKYTIKRTTGSVGFDGCDAEEIFVSTSTGNITGNLLSDKVIFAESNTGRVDVPRSIDGGRCELTTDTGNIIITVE